jgi:small subunit ribosomal protein S20
MAHSISAKKRVRQNEKHRARNRARKEVLKTKVKAFTTAITAGSVDAAETALRATTQWLDRMAAHNTIHKNAAARKRSRLTQRLNAARASGGKPAAAAPTRGKAKGKGTKAATA